LTEKVKGTLTEKVEAVSTKGFNRRKRQRGGRPNSRKRYFLLGNWHYSSGCLSQYDSVCLATLEARVFKVFWSLTDTLNMASSNTFLILRNKIVKNPNHGWLWRIIYDSWSLKEGDILMRWWWRVYSILISDDDDGVKLKSYMQIASSKNINLRAHG